MAYLLQSNHSSSSNAALASLYTSLTQVVTHWYSEEKNSINKAALDRHGTKSYALLSIEVIRAITSADLGLYAEWHAFPARLFTPERTWPVNGNKTSSQWGTGLCFYRGRRAGRHEWQPQTVYGPRDGTRLTFIWFLGAWDPRASSGRIMLCWSQCTNLRKPKLWKESATFRKNTLVINLLPGNTIYCFKSNLPEV